MRKSGMLLIIMFVALSGGLMSGNLALADGSGGGGGGGGGISVSNDVSGSSNYSRHSGNAWVSGDIYGISIDPQLQVRLVGNPQPGNLGTFDFWAYMHGSYIENTPKSDLEFRMQYPYANSGSRSINTLRQVNDQGGTYYTFDPKLQMQWSGNSYLWDMSGGGNGVNLDNLYGYNNVSFSVTGGSITSTSFDLSTYEFPDGNPGFFDDWNAVAHFSGIIEAETFSVRTVPEPASLVMFGLGGAATMYRRRRKINLN